ncbi:gamma-mobile-trio protein GmtX [Pseudomonas graminis]|uniref:gamma-mobile-trio protein GmtX n=1 Tax=Pseudomonas graminis TaxID=158627 RepID=UPI002349B5B8|nr:gamma-mobile-trio protein GmtX [Pseudomonas graminis]MDC6379874.1 gamma-mobile-trio protein GmtX [Pseudomonas graminis]
MTPQEMLTHLCEKHPGRQASLQAIYEVCKTVVDSNGTDLRYATIARLGADRGVPKAQSIANKTGEVYQALIKCFAAAQGTRKRPPKPRSSDAWADDIQDVRIRHLVQNSLAELAQAQRTIKEFVPPGSFIRIDDRSSGASPDAKLNNFERRALEYLRSDDFLRDWKLERGKLGDIVDPEGKAVFKPYTVHALEKVLKHL